jgi:hypothetical protein
MPELTEALLVCNVAAILFVSIRLNIYTFSLQHRIREYPRYENDREWSNRASRAILGHKVAKFAPRARLIEALPRWVRVYKVSFIVGAGLGMYLGLRVLHGE